MERLQVELKNYCRGHCVQTKSDERHRSDDDDDDEHSPDHTDADEDDDWGQESDNDNRFGFQRIVPDEFPLNNKHILEAKKRSDDATAADEECERVVSNWTHHEPKWKRLHTKST